MTQDHPKSRRVSRVNQMLSKRPKASPPPAENAQEGTPAAAQASPVSLATKDLKAPKQSTVVRDEDVIKIVLIGEVVEGPNPRSGIDPVEFDNLVDSIRLNGINQPILCRFYSDSELPGIKYQVVAGQRRFKAALAAGLSSIPILAKKMTDAEALVAAVTENTQRDDMTARDLIFSYERLVSLDLPNKQIIAAIGGTAKTSKVKKIAESTYWRSQVIDHGATIRTAYEGAVKESKYGVLPARSVSMQASDSPIEDIGSTLSHSGDSPDQVTSMALEQEPPQNQPAKPRQGRKRKCLLAVYTDQEGEQHEGFVHLSEISFEGETSRYIAWYSERGDHQVVSLDQLTFFRGALR